MAKFFAKKWVRYTLIALVVVVVGMQFFTVNKDNPPVTVKVAWDSPRTKELFDRGCMDCHSNETKWPWYTNVAPASWLVSRDVEKGRKHLNISEDEEVDVEELTEVINSGEMPFKPYLIMHAEARFTPEEKKELIQGLEKTFAEKSESETK